MVIRIFFFLFGFGLSVIGFTYVVGYLNLLTIGYTFLEYLIFISKRSECLMALLGILIIIYTIFKGGDNHGICI